MAIEQMIPLSVLQSLGPAGRLASDLAVQPEAAQAQSRLMAEALFREQGQQVQAVQEAEFAKLGDDEPSGNQADLSQRQAEHAESTEEDIETTASTEGPFLGNLLDHKV